MSLTVDGRRSRSFRFVTDDWAARSVVLEVWATPATTAEQTYIVSGRMDLLSPVGLGPGGDLFSPSDGSREFIIATEPLEPGIHCLLFAAVEPPHIAVAEERSQDEITTLFYVEVKGGKRNFCFGKESIATNATPIDPGSPLAGGCIPNLSPDAKALQVRRTVARDTQLWAAIPICSRSAAAILLRNGRFYGRPLFAPESARRPGWIEPLPSLTPGGWNLLGVQTSQDTVMSEPLVVQ